MSSQYKDLISLLIQRYSEDNSTESLLGYVANSNGMFAACREIFDNNRVIEPSISDWVYNECERYNVSVISFSQSIAQILTIFGVQDVNSDHYTVLGLCSKASLKEVKAAYRKLSLIHHPDRASNKEEYDSQKFIEISKAYHSIIESEKNQSSIKQRHSANPDWREIKKQEQKSNQKKSLMLWLFGLLSILVVISAIGSFNVRKRAMIAGLSEKNGAFVPTDNDIDQSASLTQASLKAVSEQEKSKDHEILVERGFSKVDSDDTVQQLSSFTSVLKSSKILKQQSLKDTSGDCGDQSCQEGSNEFDNPIREEETPTVEERDWIPEKVVRLKLKQKKILNKKTKGSPKVDDGITTNIETAGELTEKEDSLVVSKAPTVVQSVTLDLSDKVGKEVAHSDSGPNFNIHSTLEDNNNLNLHQGKLIGDVTEPRYSELQDKVEHFIQAYEHAYSQRNIIMFSRLFQPYATENEKPFLEMVPVYTDLFKMTSNVALEIDLLTWSEVGEEIHINGRFNVVLDYIDGRNLKGRGKIHFNLVDVSGALRVNLFTYTFDN